MTSRVTLSTLIFSAAVAWGCTSQPTLVTNSPNLSADANFERCMRSYADMADKISGGEVRIRQLCSDGAKQTAGATQTTLARNKEEAEQARIVREREHAVALAHLREQERREREEFDRSALGRMGNAIVQTAEARERARVQPASSSSSSAASGGNWNCDVTPTGDAKLFAQWKAECERNRARSQQSASQVAPSAARPTPYQAAAQALIVASQPIVLSPPRSVEDAPRSNPQSTVVATSSTGRFELSAAHEGKVTFLHPETKKPCLSQVGVKELSSTGKTEYFKFQNICDAVFNLRIIDPSSQGHGSAISPGSPGRPSTYTIYCAVEDRCGEGRWEYND